MNIEKVRKLDEAVLAAAKKIKVLNALAWPVDAEDSFLRDWRNGNARLPEIELARPDVTTSVKTLDEVANACDSNSPVEKFLAETALSYANAGRMIMNVGQPEFTRFSIKLYGRPDMVYKQQGFSGADMAKSFLEMTEKLLGNPKIEPAEADISAADFASWLKVEIDKFFIDDNVEVMVDEELSAKALAGAKRIRVRASALFSQLDKDQLLCHEAYVHTATQLNGRKQPNLKSLGLGSPRTTRTQEGIAVLSELITNSIDLKRLQRVALRVIAVKMALDGADFIEVFKFFLDAGQSETESVKSTQRIFRGGAVQGGVVFTKDAVYLQGLIEVHSFLRIAIRDNNPHFVRNLFAGRLTMGDAIQLNDLFESGWLVPPAYMPTWASDLRRLAALMAYSAFLTNIKLDRITLDRVIALEEEIKAMADA